MRWSLFFSASLALLLASFSASSLQANPTYYTISGIDPGGLITEYTEKYQALEKTGVTVKVDGLCISACTLVLAIFPADRICMTERGSFGFHLASSDGVDNPELTKAWLRGFPEWVLQWIVETGGVVDAPRYAFLEDFKGHLQACPGSHVPNVDMKKLIGNPDNGEEKVIFKPHQ